MRAADVDRVLEIAEGLPQAPRWARDIYEAAISQGSAPERLALVAEDISGEVVGFAVASLVVPEAELETIGVAEAWQRQGIGGHLVEEICRALGERGVTKVTLEVRRSNGAAQRVYRLHGFEELGVRPSYYADPKEDALVMGIELQA